MKNIKKYLFMLILFLMCTPSIVFADLHYVGCGSAEGIPQPLVQLTRMVYSFLVIITPIILIVFSVITMIRALKEQNADEVVKAKANLIKKFIAAAIILLIGVITRFTILRVTNNSADESTVLSCMKCFLYNADCHESDTGNGVRRGYYTPEPDSDFINDTKSNRENYKPSNSNGNPTNLGPANLDEKYHYHQGDAEWASVNLCDSGAMSSNGCNITSIAIALSILRDERITPKVLNDRQNEIEHCKQGQRPAMIKDFARLYGFNPVVVNKSDQNAVDEMFNKIATGRYAAPARIQPNEGLYRTSAGHYVCVVAAKVENGKKMILIWDPATHNTNRDNRWIELSEFLPYTSSDHSFILVGSDSVTPNSIGNSNGNTSNGNTSNGNSGNRTGVPANPSSTSGQGLWIAHQKNDKSRTQTAISKGFWGIEVDVQQKGGVLRLQHDTYHGYDLPVFLSDCKAAGVIAVLDLKGTISYSKLINVVKNAGMMDSTIFQSDDVDAIKGVYNQDSSAKIWFLNSANKGGLKMSTIQTIKDKIVAVNMLANSVTKEAVQSVHGLGLKMCVFAYGNYPYGGKTVEQLKGWGVDFLMADSK